MSTLEANGDNFNINQVSAFSVGGEGLGYHSTDQPLFDFGFAQFYRAVAEPDRARKIRYHSRGKLRFAGTAGYARGGELALFEGTRLGLDDLEVSRRGGDFGVSVSVNGKKVVGRVAGRRGGTVSLRLPARFDAAAAKVHVGRKPVAATVRDGAIHFDVAVSQSDGYKRFAVEFPAGSARLPRT